MKISSNYSFVDQVRRFPNRNGIPKEVLLLLYFSSLGESKDVVSDDGKVVVVYIPKIVTNVIQPLDENVNRLTKSFYKRSLH